MEIMNCPKCNSEIITNPEYTYEWFICEKCKVGLKKSDKTIKIINKVINISDNEEVRNDNKQFDKEKIIRRVAQIISYLRPFRNYGSISGKEEYLELRRIGEELNKRGGVPLMREVAHEMAPRVTAPPNPYVGDQIRDSLSDINSDWNGIGGWQS